MIAPNKATPKHPAIMKACPPVTAASEYTIGVELSHIDTFWGKEFDGHIHSATRGPCERRARFCKDDLGGWFRSCTLATLYSYNRSVGIVFPARTYLLINALCGSVSRGRAPITRSIHGRPRK